MEKIINTTGELLDRLSIVNIKIWHLEEKLGEADKNKKFKLAGKIAISIRKNNNIRVALKNEITKRIDKISIDGKINFTRL